MILQIEGRLLSFKEQVGEIKTPIFAPSKGLTSSLLNFTTSVILYLKIIFL